MTPEAAAAIYARAFAGARPWSAAEIAQLTDPPGFMVSAPGGFALGRALAGEAELITLAVAPEAQRQGLGRHLLNAFEEAAQAHGANRLLLEVAADNAPAIGLYDSAQWRRIAIRSSYYARPSSPAIDALIYEKQLVNQG